VSQAENHLAMKSNESGTELLFQAYFNAQYDMLLNLKPDIIGHFDLIRLFRPNFPLSERVWSLIKRNISSIKEYDGLVELNPRSLKKGLHDIYPFADILREMIAFKIKFTLGDDSHSPMEVGLHYDSLMQVLQEYNISQVYIPGSLNPISINNKWINL
jgi:histidinol-phosphatase (PHP family)